MGQEGSRSRWIRLEYLEFFSQINELAIGCRFEGHQLWISPYGVQAAGAGDEGGVVLDNAAGFELLPLFQDFEVRYFLTRAELASQISKMMQHCLQTRVRLRLSISPSSERIQTGDPPGNWSGRAGHSPRG
ncbi:MAG: hypothetical protein ACE5JX_04925 [Acidobacteriota bacterium]